MVLFSLFFFFYHQDVCNIVEYHRHRHQQRTHAQLSQSSVWYRDRFIRFSLSGGVVEIGPSGCSWEYQSQLSSLVLYIGFCYVLLGKLDFNQFSNWKPKMLVVPSKQSSLIYFEEWFVVPVGVVTEKEHIWIFITVWHGLECGNIIVIVLIIVIVINTFIFVHS